ncbi:MAG: hypothetical protein O6934_05880 [SAR324 cluster bacterium]|nr:hypothetical protein [SAR324 cluster bacterium]
MTIDASLMFMYTGFFLSAFAVTSNDSIQTLGTFLSSNYTMKWYKLWAAASAVLVATLVYSWLVYGGDVSYGRLTSIPRPEVFQWYHAAAPIMLLILTRFGIPVSTTFFVLSFFTEAPVLQKMLVKTVAGYALGAVVAYVVWSILVRFINEHEPVTIQSHIRRWRIAQWALTGWLWSIWLAHDMANIAVYLPRQMSFQHLLFALAVTVSSLGIIFYRRGGEIQKIILSKSGARYIRSATLINLVYGSVLLALKEYSHFPISTTWTFVGLLCGRELAVFQLHNKGKPLRSVFPVLTKDFFKITIGLSLSIALAFMLVNE